VTRSAVIPGLHDRVSELFQAGTGTRRVSVREGYGLWASSYDSDPNPLLALEERELELLLPGTRHKDAIDLGCGTGRWMRKLLSRGVRSVVGVDLTPQMLARAAQDGRLGRRLVQGDCLALPFRSHGADVIVCSFTLGHVPDVVAAAHEIARVARPEAEVFISDLHPEAQANGWRCAFRCEGRSFEIGGHPHARAHVHETFRSAGFRLRRSLDAFIGEPERHIFVRGGKDAWFEAAKTVPAVAVEHFILDARPGARVRGGNRRRPLHCAC